MESQFQLEHRKFIKYAINETGEHSCSSYCNSSDSSTFCQPPCFTFCPRYCDGFVKDLIPSASPSIFSEDHPGKSRKLLVITVSIIGTTFVALLCYVIFAKFYLGRWSVARRISSPQQQIINETHDDFLDDEQGSVVDHPIWYIRTVGLQPSIINEITVLKYRKGDGLVEGTECSVCLSEFQEDETLRLLPKCSHAFHISCVDTWLRSHTNCPLCRAPIVKNTAGALSSSESNIENPGTSENTQVEILVNIETETERQLEDVVVDRRNINGTEEEGESQLEQTSERNENSDEEVDGRQPIRRSVSLDSVSASKIIQGLANFVSEEIIGNSDTQLAEERDLSIKIVPKKVGRSESLLGIVGSSSIARSLQNAPVSMKRSFSCGGKFLLSRSS